MIDLFLPVAVSANRMPWCSRLQDPLAADSDRQRRNTYGYYLVQVEGRIFYYIDIEMVQSMVKINRETQANGWNYIDMNYMDFNNYCQET